MTSVRDFWVGVPVLAALCLGCGDEVEEPRVCRVTMPEDCPDPPVRYQDVTGVIEARCVVCHDAELEYGSPWPLQTYGHVAGWSDLVRDEIVACTMPPPSSDVRLSAAETEALLTWIACGIPE